jgi:hypothetical protein
VLGAIYLLWMFQKVFFGKLDKAKNGKLKDLSGRELATFVPLVIGIFLLGLFPTSLLSVMQPSVDKFTRDFALHVAECDAQTHTYGSIKCGANGKVIEEPKPIAPPPKPVAAPGSAAPGAAGTVPPAAGSAGSAGTGSADAGAAGSGSAGSAAAAPSGTTATAPSGTTATAPSGTTAAPSGTTVVRAATGTAAAAPTAAPAVTAAPAITPPPARRAGAPVRVPAGPARSRRPTP